MTGKIFTIYNLSKIFTSNQPNYCNYLFKNKCFINYLSTSEAVFGFILGLAHIVSSPSKTKFQIRNKIFVWKQFVSSRWHQTAPPSSEKIKSAVLVLRNVWNPPNYMRSLERLLPWMQRSTALRLHQPPSPIQESTRTPAAFFWAPTCSLWTHKVRVRHQKIRVKAWWETKPAPVVCGDGSERKLSEEAAGWVVTGF